MLFDIVIEMMAGAVRADVNIQGVWMERSLNRMLDLSARISAQRVNEENTVLMGSGVRGGKETNIRVL